MGSREVGHLVIDAPVLRREIGVVLTALLSSVGGEGLAGWGKCKAGWKL